MTARVSAAFMPGLLAHGQSETRRARVRFMMAHTAPPLAGACLANGSGRTDLCLIRGPAPCHIRVPVVEVPSSVHHYPPAWPKALSDWRVAGDLRWSADDWSRCGPGGEQLHDVVIATKSAGAVGPGVNDLKLS